MSPPSRQLSLQRLLIGVTALAALVFVTALGAMGRIVSLSGEQRAERARELVLRELAHVATGDGSHVLGLRSGLAHGSTAPRSGLAPAVDAALAELSARAGGRDHVETAETESEGARVLLAARASVRDGSPELAWVAYPLTPPKYLQTWRVTVAVLASATLLLGALALGTVVVASRDARGLRSTLGALEADLTIPVPRPRLAELAHVAEGVEKLARGLDASQKERAALAQRLDVNERHVALGKVVAGVAHEIRNPLAAMKLRVDLARTAPDVSRETVEDLSAVADEIARLDRLVTDFLLVSGRRQTARRACDLGALARSRAAQLDPWAKEMGVVVEVVGKAELACDTDACARAIDNLLKNAVEASPSGATVRVSVREDVGRAVVAVEDCGAGVPEDRLAELFAPFFTTKALGTGLGLTVSRAVAKANGGDVVYEREAGRTRFLLALSSEVPS